MARLILLGVFSVLILATPACTVLDDVELEVPKLLMVGQELRVSIPPILSDEDARKRVSLLGAESSNAKVLSVEVQPVLIVLRGLAPGKALLSVVVEVEGRAMTKTLERHVRVARPAL